MPMQELGLSGPLLRSGSAAVEFFDKVKAVCPGFSAVVQRWRGAEPLRSRFLVSPTIFILELFSNDPESLACLNVSHDPYIH